MDPHCTAVLTVDELSEYLKIPKSTVYKLAQEGKISGQKVGRHWRFRRATIDRWIGGLPLADSMDGGEE